METTTPTTGSMTSGEQFYSAAGSYHHQQIAGRAQRGDVNSTHYSNWINSVISEEEEGQGDEEMAQERLEPASPIDRQLRERQSRIQSYTSTRIDSRRGGGGDDIGHNSYIEFVTLSPRSSLDEERGEGAGGGYFPSSHLIVDNAHGSSSTSLSPFPRGKGGQNASEDQHQRIVSPLDFEEMMRLSVPSSMVQSTSSHIIHTLADIEDFSPRGSSFTSSSASLTFSTQRGSCERPQHQPQHQPPRPPRPADAMQTK